MRKSAFYLDLICCISSLESLLGVSDELRQHKDKEALSNIA